MKKPSLCVDILILALILYSCVGGVLPDGKIICVLLMAEAHLDIILESGARVLREVTAANVNSLLQNIAASIIDVVSIGVYCFACEARTIAVPQNQ
jgi:type IV pilus biogenesis protein CpaD/CtpE